MPTTPPPTVVLVHGAWADGSGWEGVHDRLRAGDVPVHVVQNPTTSLATDVTVTRDAIEAIDGPVILVGHSYGGAVITEAGTHRLVQALVYVTAFGPDAGESVESLIGAHFPQDGPQPPILPPVNGFLLLDQTQFPDAFAGDVPRPHAEFLAASQVPCGLEAFQGRITRPAWREKPTWYLHVTDDRMIPPVAQQWMAQRMGARVSDVPGDHAIYVSNPDAVVTLIQSAIDAVSSPT